MVEWIESLILGVVQGITEFLPVSSDGHLVVAQQIFAWLTGRPHSGEENLFFDIMLHVGTLAAILLHYRNSIMAGRGDSCWERRTCPRALSALRSGGWGCWRLSPRCP